MSGVRFVMNSSSLSLLEEMTEVVKFLEFSFQELQKMPTMTNVFRMQTWKISFSFKLQTSTECWKNFHRFFQTAWVFDEGQSIKMSKLIRGQYLSAFLSMQNFIHLKKFFANDAILCYFNLQLFFPLSHLLSLSNSSCFSMAGWAANRLFKKMKGNPEVFPGIRRRNVVPGD